MNLNGEKCVKNVIKKISLKIFKHYKLRPIFSKIKDNEAKDRAEVGACPPPPNFGRSNLF